MNEPTTLLEAIQYFSDPDNCRKFMVEVRWADEVVRCPHCGNEKVSYLEKAKLYFCPVKHPKQKFSLKVGTIFEDSPIGLDKWLPAAWLIANCKNGISSYEIARALGVTQKSAWHMAHRLRHAMKENYDPNWPMGNAGNNPVEIDETFVGGKPKNRHSKKRSVVGDKKAIVMGMLTRTTREVRATVIPDVKRETLQAEILKHVGWGSKIYTDQYVGYDGLNRLQKFTHRTVNHMTEYVNGNVHTQGIENFWSLLKRGLNGTYVAVEPFHLDRYVDEQVWRYNNRRKLNDAARFKKLLSQIVGKRLTYAELTGKVGESPAF
jgi:transposase-like protein